MSRRAAALTLLTLATGCGTSGPAAPFGDDTISLTGFIRTFIDVPDLQIAVYGSNEIAPVGADEEGAFTIEGLPRAGTFVVEVSGTGLVSTLQPVAAADDDIYGWRAAAIRAGGTRYPQGIGAGDVDVYALVYRHGYAKNGLGLAQVAITPTPSEPVDLYNDSGVTDLTGRALFRGVEAGEVELTVQAPERECSAARGWEGSGQNTARVPTALGHLTIAEVVCPDVEGSRALQGQVLDELSEEPVAGADVCVAEGCTTTNEAGVYELRVEDGAARIMSVRAAAAEYPPTLRALRNGWEAGGRIDFELLSEQRVQELAAAAGNAQAPDRAFVWFRSNASSAQVKVDPQTAVIYLDAGGAVDMSLTSSSLDGRAFAANVGTPSTTVSLSHPGLTCRVTTGWVWTSAPLYLPTAAGSVTVAPVGCYSAPPE